MKQKRYFGAMALLALVTSCANEDVFQKDVDVDNLENRPVVGQVVLDLNAPALTRWTQSNGGASFTDSDVLGACLMDTWAEGDNYTDVDYISTNYKFTNSGNAGWVSDALFVEGNYYFYMQYNEKMRNRQGLVNTIPSVQNIGEDGAASVYANQLFLGHYFINEESTDKNIPVQMVPVYAYPRINVEYEGKKSDLVIDKVVVSSDNFVLERKLNVSKELNGVEAYKITKTAGNTTVDVVNVPENSKLKSYLAGFNDHKEYQGDVEVPGQVLKAVMLAMAADGNVATPIEMVPATPASSINGAIIVPAGEYFNKETVEGEGESAETTTTNQTLTLKIYTNKGTVTAVVPSETIDKVDGDETITVRKNKGYHVNLDGDADNDVKSDNTTYSSDDYVAIDAEAFPLTLLPSEGGKGKQINVSFQDGAIEVPTTLETGSAEELGKYLTEWYTGRPEDGLTVILTADITLNSDIMTYLNGTGNPVVTFQGAGKNITIPAEADAAMINKINVAESNGPKVIIAAGAVQTITAVAEVKDNAETVKFAPAYSAGIKNNGTLTATRTGSWKNSAELTANVENNGTFTLVAGTNLVGNVTNKGTFTANSTVAGTVANNKGEVNIDNLVGTLSNIATAKVRNASTVVNGLSEESYNRNAELTITGEITETVTNYGKVYFSGSKVKDFTNGPSTYYEGTTEKTAGGVLALKGDMDVSGTLTNGNSGKVEIPSGKGLYISTELNNEVGATVDNSGTIFTVKFNNNGTLDHRAGASTTVAQNNGTINIYEPVPASLSIATQAGAVCYTTDDTDFEEGALNELWAPITNLTITKGETLDLTTLGKNVVNLTIKESATLAFAKSQSLNWLTMSQGGTLKSELTVANLKLPSGKNLLIDNGASLTYTKEKWDTGNLQGRINALGYFYATNIGEKPEEANVYGNAVWGNAAAAH